MPSSEVVMRTAEFAHVPTQSRVWPCVLLCLVGSYQCIQGQAASLSELGRDRCQMVPIILSYRFISHSVSTPWSTVA